MSKHRPMRRERMPGARSALAFLVLVCLQLALQPCAVAVEAGDDCPDCPAGHHRGTSHDTAHASAAALDLPCAEIGFDCMLAGDYSHDDRGQSKVRDVPNDAFAAIVPADLVRAGPPRASWSGPDSRASFHHGASPPLNVLYCTYLK